MVSQERYEPGPSCPELCHSGNGCGIFSFVTSASTTRFLWLSVFFFSFSQTRPPLENRWDVEAPYSAIGDVGGPRPCSRCSCGDVVVSGHAGEVLDWNERESLVAVRCSSIVREGQRMDSRTELVGMFCCSSVYCTLLGTKKWRWVG